MNTKRLSVLAVILVIIVGIIIVANQLSNRQPSEKTLAFFPQFSPDQLSSMTICDARDTVTLVRRGVVWMVSGGKSAEGVPQSPLLAKEPVQKPKPAAEYPADSASIQTALEKLKTMQKD
jgi:hypothetical protein